MIGWVFVVVCLGLAQSVSAQEMAGGGSTGSATDSLAAGRESYDSANYERARDLLSAARTADPQNPDAALLLGLTHLRLNDPGEAARHWADYSRISKDPSLATDVGRFVTILLHEDNVRAARAAVAHEQLLSTQQPDVRTVAVAAFRNLGSTEYAPLGKALAAMLIDNLSAIPDVRVLERDRVQSLLAEADLAASGLVEKETAVRAGKLLRAGRLVPGSYADLPAAAVRLKAEALVYDVASGKEVAASSAEAPLAEFHGLVPKIATDVAAAIGRPVSSLPPPAAGKVEEPHTRSLPAVMAFGRALDAIDRQDTEEAQRWCGEAQKEDPNFELARRFCLFLPPVWLSMDGVAQAVESQVVVAAPSFMSQVAPWVAGAAVAGGVAGGIIAGAASGDDGRNYAPELSGVEPETTAAPGETLTENLTAKDRDGGLVTITAENLPPNSTFTTTFGTLANAEFRFTPENDQIGQAYAPRFCAVDDGGAATCEVSNIFVAPLFPCTGEEPCLDPGF